MLARVASPGTKRVGVEVWQHTIDRRNPLHRAVANKLETCGWTVVDVRTAISHDLPILSFLATPDSLTAVLTDLTTHTDTTSSNMKRRRGCLWRERFELRGVTHADAAKRMCDTFVASRQD
jgi:hypothetical protein